MTTIICVDFGTGMSKVAASIDGGDPFPIPLARMVEDPVKEYPIDSSLLFSADGQIYFSHKAVEESLLHQSKPQRRLDSLKRRLTTGDLSDLRTVPLHKAFNQTGIEFSIADTLTLMYAHILHLTRQYLSDAHGDEVLRHVKYRFTRPVFHEDRAKWFDSQVANALFMAIAFDASQKHDLTYSVDAQAARKHLDASSKRSGPSADICKTGFLEPVAAGMLHLSREDDHRTVAAIMDIGAGTTDMALFVAIQPHGKAGIDRVKTLGKTLSVNKAGDHIDDLIRKRIESDAFEVKHMLTETDRIEIDLHIRRWKEDLFTFSETIPVLGKGIVLPKITRHSFLKSSGYKETEEVLINDLFEVFGTASRDIEFFATASDFPISEIELIPAGGGARLPVFQKIGALTWKTSRRLLGIEIKKPIPDQAADYNEEYPQLAVALGGALEGLPEVNEHERVPIRMKGLSGITSKQSF